MDLAARRFARRILLAHVLALLVVVAAVVLAARQVYHRMRDQVITQTSKRQELLASETARGIDNYYESILSNLDMIRRSDEDPFMRLDRTFWSPRAPMAMTQLFWHQLEGRVSTLFGLQRVGNRILVSYPHDASNRARDIAAAHSTWLRTVENSAISGFGNIAGTWGHLICVPMQPLGPGPDGRVALVAVVPVAGINALFLDELNQQRSVAATLVDESGVVMASSDHGLVGANLPAGSSDAAFADLVRGYLKQDQSRRTTMQMSRQAADGNSYTWLVTAQPLAIGEKTASHGKRWLLLISSPLSDVDAVVWSVFQRAVFWAILVVIAMTVLLVSTSTQMIRSRLRVERLRHDLLSREMAEARRIQLAWLPSGWDKQHPLDIAAFNEPASHISGDFYDWFDLPDGRTVITIGDVTGHGMSAAFLMATTQLLIRTTMLRIADPGKCLQEVNRQLCHQVFNGQFVTMLVLVLDLSAGTLEMASAGHYAPLVYSDGHPVDLPIESQLVLGLEPEEDYATQRFDLPDRFSLLMYTDGAVETSSPQEDQRFGIHRLRSAATGPTRTAQEMLTRANSAVRDFSASFALADDITLVAIQGQCSPQPAVA